MHAVNYTYLRDNMKECFDEVIDSYEPMIITRKSENIIVMSQSYYDSLMESVYLLSNKKNREHLSKAISEYKRGKTVTRELIDD